MKTLTNNQTLEMTPYPQSLFLQQWRVTFYEQRDLVILSKTSSFKCKISLPAAGLSIEKLNIS